MSQVVAGLAGSLVFQTAATAFGIAQTAKVFSSRLTEGKWDVRQLIASGGMPSSHSALVSGMTMAVGLQEGFEDVLFVVCFVFSIIICYDACGVRLHAGRTAEALNRTIYELRSSSALSSNALERLGGLEDGNGGVGQPAEILSGRWSPLRETLGHTHTEVACGVLLGVATALAVAGLADT